MAAVGAPANAARESPARMANACKRCVKRCRDAPKAESSTSEFPLFLQFVPDAPSGTSPSADVRRREQICDARLTNNPPVSNLPGFGPDRSRLHRRRGLNRGVEKE